MKRHLSEFCYQYLLTAESAYVIISWKLLEKEEEREGSWKIRRRKKVTLPRLSTTQHCRIILPVTLLICWNITTLLSAALSCRVQGWEGKKKGGGPLPGWGWGASFGAKPRHRHHRHIGTGCLGPRAPSVLVVRVLSGAVPSSKTHTVPLSSFVRRSNLMFQLCACHWMLTSDTGPRVPFENYRVYIGGGRVVEFMTQTLPRC